MNNRVQESLTYRTHSPVISFAWRTVFLAFFFGLLFFFLMPFLQAVSKPQEKKIYVRKAPLLIRKVLQKKKMLKQQKKKKKEMSKLQPKIEFQEMPQKIPPMKLKFTMNAMIPNLNVLALKSTDFVIAKPSLLISPPLNLGKISLYTLSELDTLPVPLFRRQPLYPFNAKRRGIEGSVRISFVINNEGKTTRIKILSSQPKGIFDDASMKAVSKWQYKPGVKNGGIVKTKIIMDMEFNLK